MAKERIRKAISFLEKSLKESGVRISQIILFGSQTKGTATGESDIDVVILSEDFEGKDIFERARLTKDAEIKTLKKFMIPLEIITMTPKEWKKGNSLIVEFAREGEVFYG